MIALVGATVLYLLSNLLLAAAWSRLLLWFGQKLPSPGVCRSIYARSQIAKYVPGNILHIAGRHMLARDAGMAHGPLALAALYEILLLVVAASGMTLLGWTLFGVTQANVSNLFLIAAGLGVPAIALLLAKSAPKISFLRGYELRERPMPEIVSGLAVPFSMYLMFILGAGLALLGTGYAVEGCIDVSTLGATVSLFAVAYIAGVITPGAPSGIGIREGILVLALAGTTGEASALLIALLFRVVTISGDVIFFLMGFMQCRSMTKGRECQ